MGLKLCNGKKDNRPLSRETGYIYYLYLRFKSLEEELLRVIKHMQETKPWYDSDTIAPDDNDD